MTVVCKIFMHMLTTFLYECVHMSVLYMYVHVHVCLCTWTHMYAKIKLILVLEHKISSKCCFLIFILLKLI